jgi:hypothetical protein
MIRMKTAKYYAILFSLVLSLSATSSNAATPPSLPSGTSVNGHLVGAGASAPTVAGASCGTPILTLGSSDLAGQFQAKGASTCAVTFGNAFASQPFCIVQDGTTIADSGFTFTTSGTKTTGFTMGTTVLNDFITWICIGQLGN